MGIRPNMVRDRQPRRERHLQHQLDLQEAVSIGGGAATGAAQETRRDQAPRSFHVRAASSSTASSTMSLTTSFTAVLTAPLSAASTSSGSSSTSAALPTISLTAPFKTGATGGSSF